MRRAFGYSGTCHLLHLVAIAFAAESAPPPAAAPRSLTLEDLEAIKSPENLVFSRDGRQIAYVPMVATESQLQSWYTYSL